MPLPNAHVNTFTVPKGKVYLKQITGEGAELGFRYLGANQEAPLSKKTETIEIMSAEGGLGIISDKQVVSASYTIKLTVADVSLDNVGLFLNGIPTKIEQVQQTDASEAFDLKPMRLYQLGITDEIPTGVRNISSVVISNTDASSADTWVAETAYILNDLIKPVTPNGHYYKCTTAGTTGATAPTWKTDGTSTTDGTAVWLDMGLIIAPTTAYDVDPVLGQIFTKATLAPANYTVEYTVATGTYYRINSQSEQYYYELLVNSDNPIGENRNWLFPRCTLEASGDLSLKSEKAEYQKIEITVNILEPTDGRNQVYCEGRPV